MSHSIRSLVATLLLLFNGLPCVVANEDLVNRKTDSAEGDLIKQLLSRGMIETATQICSRKRAEATSGSDQAAKWLLQWADVITATMLRDAPDNASGYIETVTSEIDLFLVNHPEHPRKPWLALQGELIDLASARRAILMALVKPIDDPIRETALKQVVGISSRLQELSKEVESLVAVEKSKDLDSLFARELTSLAIVIATHRIESLMLRGELFEEGSSDFIASANQSLAASTQLLESLPKGVDTRLSLLRQMIESQRRTGDLDAAEKSVTALLEEDSTSPLSRALAARIAIDKVEFDKASQLLGMNANNVAAQDLDMELARLQWEIRSAQNSQTTDPAVQRRIGDRIERIGSLHGDYARRRAERLILNTSFAKSSNRLDPRIIIAGAASRLREGAPEEAAEMLDAASREAEDSAAAIQLAIAGAAAYQKANQPTSAARLLRETSLAHFKHPETSKLHLQAAVLQSDTAVVEAIIEHLEETVRTWPEEPTATSATDWLIRLHQARQDALSAAKASTQIDASLMSAERIANARSLWITALLAVPSAERKAVANECLEAFAKFKAMPEAKVAESEILILFGENERLREISNDLPLVDWQRSLLAVRRGDGNAPPFVLTGIDAALLKQAAERLILDGKPMPTNRHTFGRAIITLLRDEPSLSLAEAHAWTSDWPRAEAMIQALIQKHSQDRAWITNAADLLSAMDDARAKRLALKLWTTLSTQSKQGSREWHDAKLRSLAIMKTLGESAEAAKAANYILLTQPNLPSEVKAAYQTLTR
jgi:hypothetical protein